MVNLAKALGVIRRLGEITRETARRWRRLAVVLALAVAVAAIGCVFLGGALYLYLTELAAPWQAAALTGVTFTTLAGLLAASPRLGRVRPVAARPSGEGKATATEGTPAAASAAMEAILHTGNLKASDLVITGLVAGIVLGIVSDRRRTGKSSK